MVDIYRRAKGEAGYTATYFLSMVSERAGYETAQYLIHTARPSDGYTALCERRRLDLNVEALLLQPEWSDLFSAEDLELARQRLIDYGFDVNQVLRRDP
jgi:hypothetical protein